MKAQETEDAELVALAALVARETVILDWHNREYGHPMHEPYTEASKKLEQMLKDRGVLK